MLAAGESFRSMDRWTDCRDSSRI